MTNHTPTPWYYDAKLDIRREIPGVSYPVAQCRRNDFINDKTAVANAAFIVRAVNNHSNILAKLGMALDCLLTDGYGESSVIVTSIRNAVTLATKE